MDINERITSGIVLVTGHYGCGKTNLSVNLALALAKAGRSVTVVDLDIVNPYFRVSDETGMLADAGVEMVAPNFAGTVLDTPSLSPAVRGAIDRAAQGETTAIIDVGGDPEGATALARFHGAIEKAGYQMLYVVNQRRLMTASVEEAVELMAEIEVNCRLRATHIVGNTHLKGETTAQSVVDAIPFAQGVAERTGLPLAFVTAPSPVFAEAERLLEGSRPAAPDLLEVGVYVKTPWE